MQSTLQSCSWETGLQQDDPLKAVALKAICDATVAVASEAMASACRDSAGIISPSQLGGTGRAPIRKLVTDAAARSGQPASRNSASHLAGSRPRMFDSGQLLRHRLVPVALSMSLLSLRRQAPAVRPRKLAR